MPDIKVRIGQQNAVKVVASSFGGSLTAENAVNATNVLGGIASVTQLINSGVSTLTGPVKLGSHLDVAGISTFTGIGTFVNDLYVGGDLYVNDDIVLDEITARNLDITGITTTLTLNVTGTSTLGVTSATDLEAQQLNVTGVSTFANVDINNGSIDGTNIGFNHRANGLFVNVEASATLGVTGQTTLTNLNVTGVSTFAGITTVTGDTLFAKQLNLSGISTFGGRIVGAATSNVIPFLYSNFSDLPSASTYHGAFAHVHARGKGYFAHSSNWYELVNKEINGTIGVGTERYNIGPTNITTLNVSGIATFGSNVSIGGTLTYEDVTNIDSVGLITARSGIRINDGGLVVTAGVSTFGGILTTTSDVYVGGDLYISDDIILNEFTAVNGNITGILTAATANVTGTLTAGLIDGGSY